MHAIETLLRKEKEVALNFDALRRHNFASLKFPSNNNYSYQGEICKGAHTDFIDKRM